LSVSIYLAEKCEIVMSVNKLANSVVVAVNSNTIKPNVIIKGKKQVIASNY